MRNSCSEKKMWITFKAYNTVCNNKLENASTALVKDEKKLQPINKMNKSVKWLVNQYIGLTANLW